MKRRPTHVDVAVTGPPVRSTSSIGLSWKMPPITQTAFPCRRHCVEVVNRVRTQCGLVPYVATYTSPFDGLTRLKAIPPTNRLPSESNAAMGSPASVWVPYNGDAMPSVEVSCG